MAGAREVLDLSSFADFCRWAGADLSAISWEVPLQACRLAVIASTQENFVGQHAPDGTPWAPLKHPRRNSKGNDQILRDTGALMASATGGAGFVDTVTPTYLEVGTALVYAGIHQHGGTISYPAKSRPWPQKPWVFWNDAGETVFTRSIKAHTITIPARPFLGFNEKLIYVVQNILADFVTQVLNR